MEIQDIKRKEFLEKAAFETNPDYPKLIERENLYKSKQDIRSPFARDYTRILHSTAYRRLKHKTQVFYNIESDHVCTRMEHVLHVESVSYTIAKYLGLNDELTRAIAMGHDLGHAPFGHFGETVINGLFQKYLGTKFWHEKNGLYFVDKIELLPNSSNDFWNLKLSYAVRDGIISHCGEKDIKQIQPRKEFINLDEFDETGKYNPKTYEGCVVKMSDKIAYVGRDIEDAINLGFLSVNDLNTLSQIVKTSGNESINTATIMSNMIKDVCENSSVEKGICLSEEKYEMLTKIKTFNYDYIYTSKRFEPFKKYASLILTQIFEILMDCYQNGDVFKGLFAKQSSYNMLISEFAGFLKKYCDEDILPESLKADTKNYKNEKIYGKLNDEKQFAQAILDFIAGMTDRYAVKIFSELITY